MKILLVSATAMEIQPTIERLASDWVQHGELSYTSGQLSLDVLITGIGSPKTALSLGAVFSTGKPDFAIQAGVGGSFDDKYPPGSVVHVIEEQFADLGVEESDGSFSSIFKAGLENPNGFPFKNGKLMNTSSQDFGFLPKVRSITVNRVHGSMDSIRRAIRAYNPEVESMEGAAFFLACLMFRIPFLEIRSISNLVEPRDRETWELKKAVDNLNTAIGEILNLLLH